MAVAVVLVGRATGTVDRAPPGEEDDDFNTGPTVMVVVGRWWDGRDVVWAVGVTGGCGGRSSGVSVVAGGLSAASRERSTVSYTSIPTAQDLRSPIHS